MPLPNAGLYRTVSIFIDLIQGCYYLSLFLIGVGEDSEGESIYQLIISFR